MRYKTLPIGVEFFSDMIRNDYYYVDKTGMIKELLENKGSVNLFTRPRRFGKTLNMTMLKCFFEIGAEESLFQGLAISEEKALCEKHMGKYPVISLSLKQVRGLNYADAEEQMWAAISLEAMRFDFLQDSTELGERDKNMMMQLSMGQGNLKNALLHMSRILCNHYHQKVIILIDEYDVPLQKAEERGYYAQMTELISQIFGSGMKTNPYMEFAVVTGCLRVVKESIFTGFNNPKMHTIIDKEYDEWFGFTDVEVQEMLTYYGKGEYYDITKQWYDGYMFGEEHVYCPWDVINWVNQIVRSKDIIPMNFWANSSGNQMIRRFADRAGKETREQLEALLQGKSIRKKLNLELTYNELDDSIENLWSVLLITGYLTYKDRYEDGEYELIIPNREIHNLFRDIIDKWFREKVVNDKEKIKVFYEALDASDEDKLERCIRSYLGKSISYLAGGKAEEKESFYHGMMLGMLQIRDGWVVQSNREAGEGRPDIIAYSEWGEKAIIFEFKYVKTYEDMESGAVKALQQIRDRNYDQFFEVKAAEEVTHVGIAFCRKECKVLIGKK